jgi:hypothetical protein
MCIGLTSPPQGRQVAQGAWRERLAQLPVFLCMLPAYEQPQTFYLAITSIRLHAHASCYAGLGQGGSGSLFGYAGGRRLKQKERTR